MRARDIRGPIAALVVTAIGLVPVAGEEVGEAAPAPAWYTAHVDFLSRGGGVFHADNAAYRSDDEPFDAYGMAWTRGPSGQTLRGRLFGLRDGEEVATFWEFYVLWHPGAGRAVTYQVGPAGTLAIGELQPPGPEGTQRMEQTFFGPDGSSFRMAHVSRDDGDTHHAESFAWVDGSWQPRRSYVWHRVGAPAASPAAVSDRFAFHVRPRMALHHLLYLWARADAADEAGRRPAVMLPERDELDRLGPGQRESWLEAVAVYRRSFSHRDLLHDPVMPAIRLRLAGLDDGPGDGADHETPVNGGPDDAPGPSPEVRAGLAAAREVLDAVEPIYRRHWWPAHEAAARAWIETLLGRLATLEEPMAATLARAFGGAWPDARVPVDVVPYASWAGAYASEPAHVVIAATDARHADPRSVEALFHEASHAAFEIYSLVDGAFSARGADAPRDLWHVLIFETAGEAARQAYAAGGTVYETYAVHARLYDRNERWGAMREAVAPSWLAFLRGELSRDAALARMVAALDGGD